jgi:hypothetical protein
MAANYAAEINGANPAERIDSIANFFSSRNIPFQVEYRDTVNNESVMSDSVSEQRDEESTQLNESELVENVNQLAQLPVLTALACPYPELAEQDRGICALENMVLTELIGERVKLTDCRLDGESCCRFQTTG